MKGIEKITIQNFKAFRAAETFTLKGKNLLVYGPNGSGKSSLYFSLYTLLQADTKPLAKIEKYFDRAENENLLNVHEHWNKKSFIKAVLTDNKRKTYTLSKTGLTPALLNGLQDWKTEHQAVTGGIFYCRGSAGFSVSASTSFQPNPDVDMNCQEWHF